MKKLTVKVLNTCTERYEEVEVTREVYEVYRRTWWNLKDDDRRFHKHQITITELKGEDSFDGFHEVTEMSLRAYEEAMEAAEAAAAAKLRAEIVTKALLILSESELALVHAIFYDNKTEPEVANELHVTRRTVYNHRKIILAKLEEEITRLYVAENKSAKDSNTSA